MWNGTSWKPLFSPIYVYDIAEDRYGYLHVAGRSSASYDGCYVSYVVVSPQSTNAVSLGHSYRAFSDLGEGRVVQIDSLGGVLIGGYFSLLQFGAPTTYNNFNNRNPEFKVDTWTTSLAAYPRTIGTYFDMDAITLFAPVTVNEKTTLKPASWTGNFGDKTRYLSVTAAGFWLDGGTHAIHALHWHNYTEINDNNNQLRYYWAITGLTAANTDAGRLYVSIIADGGGFYHIAFYSDNARTVLVGHTATYNTTGWKAVVLDGSSGLGGYINVQAVTAADADIYVDFGLSTIVMYFKNVIRGLAQGRFQ